MSANLVSVIAPYIPGNSQQFAVTAPSDFWKQGTTEIILLNLDQKTFFHSSSVCKFFYSASKADSIWKVQLCKFLPNVTVVDPNLCIFTPEQQYKVIFKRIENECKPYIAKFNHNQEIINDWLSDLKSLEVQFQEAGGKEAAARHAEFLRQLIRIGDLSTQPETCPDYQAGQSYTKIAILRRYLSIMCGANYDGTIESIDPMSIQGRILNAINVLVPNAFNDQEKFESVIEKSIAALNTSSPNSDGPTTEDVTDVAELSEKNG